MIYILGDNLNIYFNSVIVPYAGGPPIVPYITRQNCFIGKSKDDLMPTYQGYIDDLKIYTWDLFEIIPPHIFKFLSCPVGCNC